jgi:3-dehydroquinate synthase
MKRLNVETKEKTYPIYIGEGIRYQVKELVDKQSLTYSSVLIVTDDNVAPLYLQNVIKSFASSIKVVHYIIPNGEASKSIEHFYNIQTFAIEKGLDRNSLLIALGGGVVGDLGGFVASTFMRGIPFVQMPTTILAHDSAVGGKVAINHELGKNLIGSFYQPILVLYDTETLFTLPKRQLLSGYAEVIKHALLDKDPSFLQLLKSKQVNELFSDPTLLSTVLTRGMTLKASIVKGDEKEKNDRKYLNLGHTLGHAIESETNYHFLHGEAIIVGMLFSIFISERYYKKDLGYQSFKHWFEEIGYETKLPSSVSIRDLVHRMSKDKKANGALINFILLREIGQPSIVAFSQEQMRHFLETFFSE